MEEVLTFASVSNRAANSIQETLTQPPAATVTAVLANILPKAPATTVEPKKRLTVCVAKVQ